MDTESPVRALRVFACWRFLKIRHGRKADLGILTHRPLFSRAETNQLSLGVKKKKKRKKEQTFEIKRIASALSVRGFPYRLAV